MKIIVDCLGGDKSPQANCEGALLALKELSDLRVILVGDQEKIRNIVSNQYSDRIEIIHAPETITGNDKPTDAIRLKKDSSMVKSIKMLREDDSISALVSTGATGSLVAAATLRIGRIEGVRRPAFCPILPTMNGGLVGICDSGANVDITVEQMLQFAIMGSRYLESAYGIEKPRVAMLNIGIEEEKGDELRKAAYPLLKNAKTINFVGNMESRDLLSGNYDLIVCDGFSGNVLVKTTEGTSLQLLKKIKTDIYSKVKYKIGALFMKQMFIEEKEFMNYQNYGGSVLLGCEKVIVKGHGSSNAVAVSKCIEQAYRMVKNDLNSKIKTSIEATSVLGNDYV